MKQMKIKYFNICLPVKKINFRLRKTRFYILQVISPKSMYQKKEEEEEADRYWGGLSR